MSSGLPWFRMDTDIHSNPKVVIFIAEHGAKAKAALAVWHMAIGFASAHATDGLIERPVLRVIHGSPADARLLVEAGFFEPHEKGWTVKGFTSHQPTKETVDAAAAARSEHGRKAANARWGNA